MILLSREKPAARGMETNSRSPAMRRQILLAVLAAVSALAAIETIAPASAKEAIQDRYCLQGRIWGYPGNCQFSNYNQCMASASGTDAYCGINPTYTLARERSRPPKPRY